MAEKGKPPDDSWFDIRGVFARTPVDDAIDRAFEAMLAERMRLLDEEMMNGPTDPPLGIFGP